MVREWLGEFLESVAQSAKAKGNAYALAVWDAVINLNQIHLLALDKDDEIFFIYIFYSVLHKSSGI